MTDVITLIESDHRAVEALFAQFAATSDTEGRQRIIEEIRLALAPHAAAEEILVYPAVRRAGEEGKDEAKHSIDEHQEIKKLLSEVDKMAADDPALPAKVGELERAVAHHVEEEESDVLATLRASTDPKRLEEMGQLFASMKPLLPTHPHPLVPGTATAQLLAGPLASVADRIRDLVSR